MSKPMSNTHVTIYIRKMTWLTWVRKNDHSFQGEALFRQGREKGATPRQKFIRETYVSAIGKNRVTWVSPKGVTNGKRRQKCYS